MPLFRKRSTFTVPRVGAGGLLLILLLLAVVGGVAILAFADIKPPTRTFEQEIPRERFSR